MTNWAVDRVSLSLTRSKIRAELTVATRQVWSNMLVEVLIILDYQRSNKSTLHSDFVRLLTLSDYLLTLSDLLKDMEPDLVFFYAFVES